MSDDETATRREATFLFLRCPKHRRRRRPGLKTAYRPGEACEDCRMVMTAERGDQDDETVTPKRETLPPV